MRYLGWMNPQAAHDEHHRHRHKAAGRKRFPGELGGVTVIFLQYLWHDLGRRDHDRPNAEHDQETGAELPARQHADIDDRIFLEKRPWREQQQGARRESGEDDDERGPEPIILLALVEHDFERAQKCRHQQEADKIETRAPRRFSIRSARASGFSRMNI